MLSFWFWYYRVLTAFKPHGLGKGRGGGLHRKKRYYWKRWWGDRKQAGKVVTDVHYSIQGSGTSWNLKGKFIPHRVQNPIRTVSTTHIRGHGAWSWEPNGDRTLRRQSENNRSLSCQGCWPGKMRSRQRHRCPGAVSAQSPDIDRKEQAGWEPLGESSRDLVRQKCSLAGPTPDFLHQNLTFNQILRWFMCIAHVKMSVFSHSTHIHVWWDLGQAFSQTFCGAMWACLWRSLKHTHAPSWSQYFYFWDIREQNQ